ncbi:DUF131 domain-containing protein [Candidatus Woesearchaeota archaeon]|nr:DUF131 domain-containing protein [Candidatus Woesearchaeota archaeon]
MNSYQLFQAGMFIIFIGIIVLIIASFLSAKDETKITSDKSSTAKFSVIGIFGFIPFGFGNDKKMLIVTLILAIIIMIVSFFLFYRKVVFV